MCSACCGGASGRTFPSRGCDGCPAPRAGGLLTQCVRYRPCLGAWSCRGPSQVKTCHVVSRPVPGGGSRLSLEKARTQRVAGGGPPPPLFRARLLSLARFGGCAALFRSMGYYGAHVCTLIWGLSFTKMLFSIFFLENASQIGFSIPDEIAPPSYQRQRSRKRASGSKRAINPGSRGLAPGPLSPHFSGEMGTPAGQAGPPGRCASRVLRSSPPQGYAGPGCPRPPGLGAARSHSLIFGIVVSGTAESLLLQVS